MSRMLCLSIPSHEKGKRTALYCRCCPCPRKFLFAVNRAAFHYESDLREDRDFLQRIARNRDDVGEITGLQRTDLALPSQQLCAMEEIGLQHRKRGHPILHHQDELPRLSAVRKRAHVGSNCHRDSAATCFLNSSILRSSR